jgi:hypothetical protein
MTPAQIPADYVLAPYQRRLTAQPPADDPTSAGISPVDVIAELLDDGHGPYWRFCVLMEVEPDDWRLWGMEPPAEPARFWMYQITSQMVPFACVGVGPKIAASKKEESNGE